MGGARWAFSFNLRCLLSAQVERLRRKFQGKGLQPINLEIIGLYVLFKAMSLDEISKR